jgi:hypothetical protein
MAETKSPAEEPAHDVLAAEAFAVPASDPALHHRHVLLPDDPAGISEPHDVLAAEEFPMPVGPRRDRNAGVLRRSAPVARAALIAGALLAAGALAKLAAWVVARIWRRR